jgi:flagellar motor switch protein FliN/FliY
LSANLTLQTSAASALAELLPTPAPLIPEMCLDTSALKQYLGSAVTASFVGALSADIALVLTDTASLGAAAGADSALLTLVDVLRPAFEAATTVLGAGVLGESSTEDASDLVSDAETTVFELAPAGAGTPSGWFAIRIREHAASGAGFSGTDSSVVDKLGRINNVEMTLAVEIGRTRMSVRDVLDLEPGHVIELDRSAGAPADVLLNGRLIARGEVVVVDQDYGIRITKILDVAEAVN